MLDDSCWHPEEHEAAHLAIAQTYAEAAPPDRQRRLQVAIASLNLSLARRRGHLAGVVEQVKFLDSPVTGPSDEDIALGSDSSVYVLEVPDGRSPPSFYALDSATGVLRWGLNECPSPTDLLNKQQPKAP